jgi:cystathionine beta-lyase/cystathionine gamma-synthase
MRGFGGMISFYVKGGRQQAEAFLQALTLPILAVSLGGL